MADEDDRKVRKYLDYSDILDKFFIVGCGHRSTAATTAERPWAVGTRGDHDHSAAGRPRAAERTSSASGTGGPISRASGARGRKR